MKYVYPALFTPLENGEYDARVPSLPGCHTCGENLADAIFQAQAAAEEWLFDAESRGEPIPPAQPLKADEPQLVSHIAADTDEYRRKYDNRAVKKTLSIPSWLNTRAEQAGVNFSQVLQDGLRERLHID